MILKNCIDPIYKYMPFSVNALKMLIKSEIWFGNPINFNDPFEGEFTIKSSSGERAKEIVEEFYKKDLNYKEQQIAKKLEAIKQDPNIYTNDLINELKRIQRLKYGVSCFTKSPDDILMWAHYADSGKGICLVFGQSDLEYSLKQTYSEMKYGRVIYEENLPKADVKHNGKETYITIQEEVILTKLKRWVYEEEYRFYNYFTDIDSYRGVKFNKMDLKGIIFGNNIASDDKNTLVHLMTNIQDYKVQYWESKRDIQNHNITMNEITPVFLGVKI